MREASYNLRQGDRDERKFHRKQRNCRVGEIRSRGKVSVGLGSLGFEHKIMDTGAGMKIYAKNMLKETAAALSAGTEW